jgi:hypothetical protein
MLSSSYTFTTTDYTGSDKWVCEVILFTRQTLPDGRGTTAVSYIPTQLLEPIMS